MNMKSDDLERLEESQEMQQLIRSAKEQYEQEKSAQPPVPYSVFARTLKERQKGEKMEVKQKPFGRGVLGEKHKYGKRSEISPWWLVAACLLGCIIGYGVSNTPDSRETDTDRLALYQGDAGSCCTGNTERLYPRLPFLSGGCIVSPDPSA